MNLKHIFDVFSKRKENKKYNEIKIEENTRIRILMILKNPNENNIHCPSYSFERLLLETRDMLLMKLGKFQLIKGIDNELEDIVGYIRRCKGEDFLDFLEYVFKTKSTDLNTGKRMIVKINYIFKNDNVQFRLTKYSTEIYEDEELNWRTEKIIIYPQIIDVTDSYIYSDVTKPTLDLLRDNRFVNANKEFLEALRHYKKNDYKECITSCCSSLESVIKIICSIKKWEYKKDTLSGLVEFIMKKNKIPSCFQNIFVSVATVRNKLGSSHGRGDKEIVLNKNEAKLQINITASNIMFLISEILD